MKKILSLVLIFVLTLTFAGLTQEVKAADGDATVYFHVNQFDGDYANTGIGIWDGIDWNGWGDNESTTVMDPDGFGAVVKYVIPAAKLADGNLWDEIQLEITRSVTAGDDAGKQAGYLSPGDGKVFADITSLKDGSATELHVYYVEGAEDVVIPSAGNGVILVAYIDPAIAGEPTAYDGWNVWTWDNGTNGSADGVDFSVDMFVEGSSDGETFEMLMKLAVIEVDDDADKPSGFIVRTEDWAKQCPDNILIDNTNVRGSGGAIYYYHAESCEVETDGNQFISDVSGMFKLGLKNKFVAGTAIVDPMTIDVSFFTQKAYNEITADRFTVKDADGNVLPILGVKLPNFLIGEYESNVTIQAQTHVVLFVETDEDHAQLGVVGNIQGWNPSNAITSSGDVNGYAVFEFTTYETEAQFKVLVSGVDDPLTTEVDEGAFAWGDAELIGDNSVVDLSSGGRIEVYLNDADDTYTVTEFAANDVDIANYTYTSGVTCAAGENLFTLFLDTELAAEFVGLVGSIQVNDWTPAEAIMATGETDSGELVFEVCMTDVNVEYKVLYNPDIMEDDPLTTEVDETVTFAWGNAELVTSNVVVDFGEGTTDGEIAHAINTPIITLNQYEPALEAESTYLLSIYMVGDFDPAKTAIVGTLNGWDIGNVLTTDKVDEFGNLVFDIPVTAKVGDYIVLIDNNDNGFGWDDKASGSPDYHFDMGADNSLIQVNVAPNYDNHMALVNIGADLSVLKTSMFSLEFAPGTFVWGEEYTIEYLEFSAELVAESDQVLDGDFENETSDLLFADSEWNAWYGDQWSGVTTSTVEIINGELVVDVIYDDSGTLPATYATQVYQEGFAVENGKFYRISFDAKADAAKDLIVAFGDALDSDPWFTDFVAKTTFNLTTEMQTFVLDFEMMEATTADQGKLVFELATAVLTKVYIDNVKIEEITALPTEGVIPEYQYISYDLGFNEALNFVGPSPVEGMGTYAVTPTEIQVGLGMQLPPLMDQMLSFDESVWMAWYGDQWSGETTSTVEIMDGELVVDVIYEGTPQTYATQVYQEGFAVENGKFYRISFDAKADAAKDVVVAFGNALDYDPWFTDFVAKTTFNVTTTMDTYTLEFEMTQPTTMDQGKLVFELATAVLTKVYIDNVMIEEIDALGGTAVADTDIVVDGDFETQAYELVLRDEMGNVVPFESYEYANMAGEFESDKRCKHDEQLIFVHVGLTNTVIDSLDQLGVVGTVNGWDVTNSIQAAGMDSNGNYVIEICIPEDATNGEFKVKFDKDMDGFTWDGTNDPEITPGNVLFNVADGPHFFVEEGSSQLDVSMTHKLMLTEANMLDKTKEYTLEFIDENGFVVYINVDMDTQAPVVDYAVIPDVEFMVDSTMEFDLMNYYTKLQFLDNREGELEYEIVTPIDLTTDGVQTVVVKAMDMWMNETTFEIEFTVYTPVVLPTISGDETVTFDSGATEPNWEDYITYENGTLTINDSQVDMVSDGVFYVIFNVENDNGDIASHTLEVTIENEPAPDTGCFASISLGTSIVLAVAALGGAVVLFSRKR